MYDDGARIFVEVGPRSVLSGLVGRILGDRPHLADPGRPARPRGARTASSLPRRAGRRRRAAPARAAVRGRSVDASEPPRPRARRRPAALPPALWLVDGGSARPAESAVRGTLLRQATLLPTNVDGDEHEHETKRTPRRTSTGSIPRPARAAGPGRRRQRCAAGERVGDVMSRHLQLCSTSSTPRRRSCSATSDSRGRPTRRGPARHRLDPWQAPRSAPRAPRCRRRRPAARRTAPVPRVEAAAARHVEPAPLRPLPAIATNGHVASDGPDIADRLLEIVSERTGYPREMLELDADLEADLGIDSIKRVEIVGTMIQSLTLGRRLSRRTSRS